MLDLHDRLVVDLGARYRVVREVGRGGMATVYLARDVARDRDAAVKVLDPDLALAVGADRFRREVDIASRLQHPHILPVWDVGEAAGSLYYTMPFLHGESLRARLDRERQLSVEEAVHLACEAAEALDYAHAQGVVHRDVKPENILLEDGHAFVADFGIARAVTSGDEKLTQTGIALGTPTYMSPEQVFAERAVDGRADVYALGVVLYEMLAGEPPFSGPNAQAIMARHTMEHVPQLSIVRQSVPEHVEEAIYRALAKTPADRFATARAFAEALRTPGPRDGVARRTPRLTSVERRRRKLRRLAYSVAAALPIVAGGAGAFWYLRPTPLAADEMKLARRVAVLFFDDLSDGGRLAPVADGLTTAVIDALAQVDQLDVVSRRGVEPFRGRDVEPDSVGRALRAGSIVRGAVEPARGDSVRVRVRLVNAATGETVGKEKAFKEAAGNVLALRAVLAGQVAAFLRQRLGEEVRLRQTRAETRSVAAWTLEQRATRARRVADSLWAAGDTVATERALGTADSLLAGAAAADPQWADPLAERAAVARTRAEMARAAPLDAGRWIDAGVAHADRALARDPRSAAAYEQRGALRFLRLAYGLATDPVEADLAVRTAERDLKRATQLDPARADAWVVLSQLDYRKLDIEGANRAARRAYEADAYLSAARPVLWRLFVTSYDLQNAADADQWCAKFGARFPGDVRAARCRLMVLTLPGVRPDVAAAWRLLPDIERRADAPRRAYERSLAQIYVGAVVGRAGLADSARRVLARARVGRDIDARGELAGFEAFAHVAMGDEDGAIALLRGYLTAHPEHRAGFAKLKSWWWAPLRGDPRFQELVGAGG